MKIRLFGFLPEADRAKLVRRRNAARPGSVRATASPCGGGKAGLRRDDAVKLREELRAVIRRYEEHEHPDGTRVHFTSISHPDMGEIRKAYREVAGHELSDEVIEGVFESSDAKPIPRRRGRPRKEDR